jgi:hypothetical protein
MSSHVDRDSPDQNDPPSGQPVTGRPADAQVEALLQTYASSFRATPELESRVLAIAARNRRLTSARWMRIGLVAASFGAIAAVGAYLIQGPRVLTIVGITEPVSSLRPRLISFLWQEHERCGISEQVAAEKFTVRSLDKVTPQFASYLSAAPDLDGLEKCGLRFLGAGKCSVPGREPSIHLRFDSQGSSELGDVEVSVFIQSAGGALPLEPGRTCSLVTSQTGAPDGESNDELLAWKSDGLVYFVVCRSPAGRQRVASVLRAPHQTGRI